MNDKRIEKSYLPVDFLTTKHKYKKIMCISDFAIQPTGIVLFTAGREYDYYKISNKVYRIRNNNGHNQIITQDFLENYFNVK